MTTSVDVAVVGGGPAGLTVADAAVRRGHSVLLIEAAPTVGGMSASFEIAGQRVDYGSHRLHPAAPPEVAQLLADLLGDDLQIRPRRGRLRVAGGWTAFPLQPKALARDLPIGIAARATSSVAGSALRRAARRGRVFDGPDTYETVISSGLGSFALERFHRPMSTKLWGVDPSELDGELARRRISVRSPGALISALRRGPQGTFWYPRLGFGQVVEALAARIVDGGATILTSTEVAGIAFGDVTSKPMITLGDRRRIEVGRIFWTGTAESLMSACSTAANSGASRTDGTVGEPATSGSAPTRRGVVLVYLALKQNEFSSFDAHYVPDLDVPFHRLSEPKKYRDGPDPVGQTVLCAEIASTPSDVHWQASDAELETLVIEAMSRIGLAPSGPVVHCETRRIASVYPVLRPGDQDRRARLLASLDDRAGVTLLGRQGRISGDNIHHVMQMGLDAAACLGVDGAWDRNRWANATQGFERFVVED